MYSEEYSKYNRMSFCNFFDSLRALICAAGCCDQSVDSIGRLTDDFISCAVDYGGKCQKIGIEVLSKIIGIPIAALEENLKNKVIDHS